MTMREKMARAIFNKELELNGSLPCPGDTIIGPRCLAYADAALALDALMEPSEGMVDSAIIELDSTSAPDETLEYFKNDISKTRRDFDEMGFSSDISLMFTGMIRAAKDGK